MVTLKIGNKLLLYIVIALLIILVLGCVFLEGLKLAIDKLDDILPYERIYQYILYDHITYNGVSYYFMGENDIPKHIDTGRFIEKRDCVVLVDENNVPYEEGRFEDAWFYADDPDLMFIYFNSAPLTRVKELAGEWYGFQN